MKESSSIAQTYSKNFLYRHFCDKAPDAVDFLEQQDIHIHFPEGAIPKDGPSAGITITTALVGLALKEPVAFGLGMTGEISLNGKVLKIGGVKEKTMAAAREGLTTLIFPLSNKKDVERLPENIKGDIKFHFVENYDEVFKIAFPDTKSGSLDG
jgi:ATP-dependent Lon protease